MIERGLNSDFQRRLPRGMRRFLLLIGSALLALLILSGCASNYVPVPCPEARPVPASLLRQHSPDASAFSSKVSSFLTKVEDYLGDTGRSTTP